MDGKEFWESLERIAGAGLIATFRFTLYPLNITSYMVPNKFPKGTADFSAVVSFGTEGSIHISKATIVKKLKEMVDAVSIPSLPFCPLKFSANHDFFELLFFHRATVRLSYELSTARATLAGLPRAIC